MRKFIFLILLAFGGVAKAETPRPNFLFVFIDDMGYADLGCFGGKARTPAIDSLARDGIRFTQFYVNAPICSPSRVAVTTGQYPGRHRITTYLGSRRANQERGVADWLSPDAPTLPRMLAAVGYHTAHVGKWHMGGQREINDAPPITAYGFSTSLTNFEGLGPRILPIFAANPDGTPFEHGPTQTNAAVGGPIRWVDRHEVTRAFVDRAIEEVQAARKRGVPFYINLWPDDMHSPIQAHPDVRKGRSPAEQYLLVLEELDRQLGRIFEVIRSDPELAANTVILLASDNGPEPGLGSAGELRGHKSNLYEGGIRSPLIVWSGRIAPSARGTTDGESLLAGMDLPPSILRIAGVDPGEVIFDGLDRSDALLGRGPQRREQAIMWVRPPDRPGPQGSWPDLAIRRGKWKLLVKANGRRPELYDLEADPSESTNLAAENPELVEELRRAVLTWYRSIPQQTLPTSRPAGSRPAR